MLYFIPAWYQKNSWSENEQNWHARRMHTEFDDTVKQVQLFHRSGAYSYRIILLSFAPNFRHFLHRQGVYHAPYWSCFDAIQEVKRKKASLFSFHNLNWPDNIEFVYTPFVVVAKLYGRKYAQIEFGEDGNPIQIDMYNEGVIQRRNLYDDRGFVGSTILYENGRPVYQDYLMENGIWKMRHFFSDHHVEINAKYNTFYIEKDKHGYQKEFAKQTYHNVDEIIDEVLKEYVRLVPQNDIFCVAMHERHAEILQDVLYDRKTILSFYGERMDHAFVQAVRPMILKAGYIVTDARVTTQMIQTTVPDRNFRIVDISPYDTRVDFGISQQLQVQNVLVPVDGIGKEDFLKLVAQLGDYIQYNPTVRFHLFTRDNEYNRPAKLLQSTRDYLRLAGMEERWAIEEAPEGDGENQLDREEKVPVYFFVDQCVDELSVSKCLRKQRLIVDMRPQSDLFLRISGISMGIPQVLMIPSQYVEDGRNGRIIQDIEQLKEVIPFYLDGLANWNAAMVESFEIGKQYTTGVLLGKWKEVLEYFEHDSSFTVGRE